MKKHYILGNLRGKDTDAALILQLNAELLGTGVRLPNGNSPMLKMSRWAQNIKKKIQYVCFGLTSKSFEEKKM